MASQWLKARQTKYGAYAAVLYPGGHRHRCSGKCAANRYNKSYDATSNKRYSLSDQTKKIVTGLKQGATITYFNQSTRFQDGKDLLDEYANLSPKVRIAYVDPDKNPQQRGPLESASSAPRWCRLATRKRRRKASPKRA